MNSTVSVHQHKDDGTFPVRAYDLDVPNVGLVPSLELGPVTFHFEHGEVSELERIARAIERYLMLKDDRR